MTTIADLYELDDATLVDEYVDALFGELKDFLLRKGQGHCQRVDYLPRRVMRRLAERLAGDADLQAEKIVCRTVTDKPAGEGLEDWEVSGSGAVSLREDATYGRVRVFCALFPSGIRLAEEDSLNVATFKTDDAESFNVKQSLERHLWSKVNVLPPDEADILKAILNSDTVRSKPVTAKLRYVLAVLGERERSGEPVDWAIAGAYLYEVHLIPDTGLKADILGVQIVRNGNCSAILLDGEKDLTQNIDRLVTEQGLEDEDIRRALAVYLATRNTLKAEEWLPPICHDQETRDKLSFDNWTFADPIRGIKVELKPLQDPKTGKVAKGLVLRSGALTNDGKKPIQARWVVSPTNPAELGGYRITVIRKTEDGEEIDVIPAQSATAKRKSWMLPMADNDLDEDEKCVARIRIQAVNKSGVPIQDATDESEDFWIENGEEFAPPPPDRGTRLRHLDELRFRVTHKTGKTYDTRSRGWAVKRDYVYSLRLTNNERGDLVLSPLLLQVERFILRNPNNLGVLKLNAVNRRRASFDDFEPVDLPPAVNEAANAFYRARARFFETIAECDDGTGVIETADLHAHTGDALRYVQAYVDMMKELERKVEAAVGAGGVNTVLHDYAALMRIDTIHMRVGPSENQMEVLLLAPTHPLRVLWLHQYETFVRRWIQQMDGKKPEEIDRLISEDSIEKLVSLNIPNAVSWDQARVFINTDNLDLFWSILPEARVPDLRTAVNAALQVLGATAREIVVSTVSPRQVADKIDRYLCHHPYVKTLKINVINPGSGLSLLEAIKHLLGRELYHDLNFDLKFFAPHGTRHQLVGNAFDDLMLQREDEEWVSGRTLSETEERLLRPNPNPLFPKLIYAKHDIAELLEADNGRFEAHLTFVIDFFGTTVATREHDSPTVSCSLHNMLAEYVTDYISGQETATWSRMIAPSRCPDLASDGNTARLFESHDGISHLAACFFDWGKSLDKYPTVQLELTDAHGKNHLRMLKKVHDLSDWVFTIDRNFGIEYYDDPAKGPGSHESGGYLIDYTPEFLDAVSHRLIISTSHQHEIESILRAGFDRLLAGPDEQEEIAVPPHTIGRVLQVLKSVSGKLALKLINNPNQAQEVIGLALTRLALEDQARLTGRVLIPVDSHIDLFHQSPKELEHGELTLKRTDLMLVALRGREAHIDLIEVKNRRHASAQQMLDLQTAIQEKNTNTERHFRAQFLASEGVKRFDADIKNKELANIIAFYFERAQRYGLFAPQESEEALAGTPTEADFRKGLEAIAAGACEVTFRHEGFIFNGKAVARDVEDKTVHNNEIHEVGRVGIQRLLGLMIPPPDEYLSEEPPDETPPKEPSADAPAAAISEGGSPQYVSPVPDESVAEEAGAEDEAPEQAEQPDVTPEVTEPSEEAETTADEPSPPTQTGRIRVFLGENVVTGQRTYWDPYTTTPRRLTNQHVLVVGKSGAGKTETTKSLIWELSERGVPTIIFDYQGEYAVGDFRDVVEPQVFDVMQGLPINPFELPIDPLTGQRKRPIEMVFQLANTLNTVFGGSGDIQLGILREAIEECYVQQGFRMREPGTEEKEPPRLEMLEAVLDQWAKERGSQVRNLQVRLQPLFKGGIFSQDQAAFSFDDLLRETSVILMTSGIKDLMLAASRLMLEKLYGAMLTAGMSRELRVMVCVDEAHKLCGDETITSLIKEARKYGLGMILSSQETRDFHSSVFANSGTIIALALEDADATVMAKNLGLTDGADRRNAKDLILNQANGQALVRSQHFLPYHQVQVLSFEDRIRRARNA